jgi:dTDP-4-dehydrorhamnose reductase
MSQLKVLVTGANGQLGMELRQLAPLHKIYDFVFVSREELAIENEIAVRNLFESHRFSWCINCAAYTAVDKAESEKEQAFLINATAPGILAKICKAFNARFIHISTDYVFDGSADQPLTEASKVNPQSVYGASKLEGEKLVSQNCPDSIIIRTSWVYSKFGKNFVKTMMHLMKDRPQLKVVSDQVGSPTYAADLAKAIIDIMNAPVVQPGIFHFSNEGVISWFEFAKAIKEELNSQCEVVPIPTSDYPTPAKRPLYSVMDKTKIQTVYGMALRPWKDSLRQCISQLLHP